MILNEILVSIEMGLIYGIVAIGIYITFRVIDFPDLTCDGSFVLGAAISAVLVQSGVSPWMGIFAATCAGAIAGMVTGLLYIKFRVTNLLAGILVAFMLYSVNLNIMGGVPNLSLLDHESFFIVHPVLMLCFFAAIVVAIFSFILLTDFGLALRSLGQNLRLALNSGVNVSLTTLFALGLSNAAISLAGALFAQHQGFADIGSGVGTVIIGLASVMIGERVLNQNSIWIQLVSCILGSIIYRLFIGIALYGNVFGLKTTDLNLITGILVIIIMNIPKKNGESNARA